LGEWADIVVPVLSLVFAVFSWWFSRRSRKDRADAARAAAEAAKQRDAIERIADSITGAPLAAVPHPPDFIGLLNRAGRPLAVEGFDVDPLRVAPPRPFPFTLAPGQEERLRVPRTSAHPGWPHQIPVRLEGRFDPVFVSVPGS
jgi:hypothetical protein